MARDNATSMRLSMRKVGSSAAEMSDPYQGEVGAEAFRSTSGSARQKCRRASRLREHGAVGSSSLMIACVLKSKRWRKRPLNGFESRLRVPFSLASWLKGGQAQQLLPLSVSCYSPISRLLSVLEIVSCSAPSKK